jgi:RHS repeat-associated protein
VARYEYAYTDDGRPGRITIDGQVADYTYDRIGQLTDVNYSDGQPDESYRYDINGNRTSSTGPDGPRSYTTGAGNRLLSDGVHDFTYSETGEMLTRTEVATGRVTTYEYDHRGRLTGVVERDAGGAILEQVEYAYDVFDRRIAVSADGERTVTVYSGESAWSDHDGSGAVVARYLFGEGIDELLARWRPGEGTSWPLADRLGTIRAVLDRGGELASRTEYASFGQILSRTDPQAAGRFTFTGREFDPHTGLYHYRARAYDPALGRFTREDPIRFQSGDFNHYRYVANEPTDATDPSGTSYTETGVLIRRIACVALLLGVVHATVDALLDAAGPAAPDSSDDPEGSDGSPGDLSSARDQFLDQVDQLLFSLNVLITAISFIPAALACSRVFPRPDATYAKVNLNPKRHYYGNKTTWTGKTTQKPTPRSGRGPSR